MINRIPEDIYNLILSFLYGNDFKRRLYYYHHSQLISRNLFDINYYLGVYNIYNELLNNIDPDLIDFNGHKLNLKNKLSVFLDNKITDEVTKYKKLYIILNIIDYDKPFTVKDNNKLPPMFSFFDYSLPGITIKAIKFKLSRYDFYLARLILLTNFSLLWTCLNTMTCQVYNYNVYIDDWKNLIIS